MFVEGLEREGARVLVLETAAYFFRLFISEAIARIRLLFHLAQNFRGIFLPLRRPSQYAIKDGFDLFSAHAGMIAQISRKTRHPSCREPPTSW